MEITNLNKVTLPELPLNPGKKLRLAYEVAERIIAIMNINHPANMPLACIVITHHENQSKRYQIYLATGGFTREKRIYNDGKLILESVIEKLSNISCINSVSIDIPAFTTVGTFTI